MGADSRRWSEGDRLSGVVIGCATRGMNRLGAGSAEAICENAFADELTLAGLAVLQQQAITARYDSIAAGEYASDLLVCDSTLACLVELNAVRALDKAHMAHCIDYLTATGVHVCLLLDFGRARSEAQQIVRDLSASTRHRRASAYIHG